MEKSTEEELWIQILEDERDEWDTPLKHRPVGNTKEMEIIDTYINENKNQTDLVLD